MYNPDALVLSVVFIHISDAYYGLKYAGLCIIKYNRTEPMEDDLSTTL